MIARHLLAKYIFIKASNGKQVKNLRTNSSYNANVRAIKLDENNDLIITMELEDL